MFDSPWCDDAFVVATMMTIAIFASSIGDNFRHLLATIFISIGGMTFKTMFRISESK